MDIVGYVYRRQPSLKRDLIAAKMRIHPYDYIGKSLKQAFVYGLLVAIIVSFPTMREGWPLFFPVIAFVVIFWFFFTSFMKMPRSKILRIIKDMDNDILFTGRYLLIKLSSGKPLLNAMDDTAKSPGAASRYIKEIVDEVNFGTPIEEALKEASELAPSRFMRKILFQIHSALRVGIDVTSNLQIVLDEIEHEQALEIERYAKKLNSLALFYMIAAVIIPSLGMTISMIILSLVSFEVNVFIYSAMIAFIIVINVIFMLLFRGIRPAVSV